VEKTRAQEGKTDSVVASHATFIACLLENRLDASFPFETKVSEGVVFIRQLQWTDLPLRVGLTKLVRLVKI
jgi:hypothetical protein